MNNISNGTGITQFVPGQALGSSTMNDLNRAINLNTEVTNNFLLEYINPNVEENDFTTKYTLESILPRIPIERRKGGVKLRFLGENGWEEYVYLPGKYTIETWLNPISWGGGDYARVIDGGEW